MRHAICYVSNADEALTTSEINELLIKWEESNNQNDLKGILLYSEGNFFQVLEGEKEKVVNLWGKIQKDKRHYGIITVIDRTITQGSYDDYKATILSEGEKYNQGLPPEYTETLKGINPDIKRVMESMMKNFIATKI